MSHPQEADGGVLVDVIQDYLEHRNWQPVSGAGWRWVEHTFDNGYGTLGLHFSPSSPSHLHFTYEDETRRVRLEISFSDSPVQLLEAIDDYRPFLAPNTWPSFVETLLRRSSAVVALADETDEEDIPIRTVEDGIRALKEIDWEYLEEGNDHGSSESGTG